MNENAQDQNNPVNQAIVRRGSQESLKDKIVKQGGNQNIVSPRSNKPRHCTQLIKTINRPIKYVGKVSQVEMIKKKNKENAKTQQFKSTPLVNPNIDLLDSDSDQKGMDPKKKSRSSNGSMTQDMVEQKLEEATKESKISQRLSDLTIKRVIMLIFSVMVSIPFFS